MVKEEKIMSGLSQAEIDRIYRMQQRVYWEADFVNRCIDRRTDGTGRRDFPYDSLVREKMLLDAAYGLYLKIADCNVAYNETLDAVIDEIERRIADGTMGHMGWYHQSWA